MISLIFAIIDNFKCLSAHICDDLNKKDTIVFVYFINAYETLRKKLSKFMKIAKKFNEELKLANLEKEELIVRFYDSNKKNEFLRNQFSSQNEKMKSLEQKLAEAEAKPENLSNTKLDVDNRSVSVSVPIKPNNKVYVSPFKRNHKENTYFVRLDKGKSSDVDAKVSKPKSKPTDRLLKKFVFIPTCHICSFVGHISPNCSLLRKKSKSESRSTVRNTDVPKLVRVCHFCGLSGHIRPNCHKLKFKHSVFQSRICDDISPTISHDKLFHMLLKNISLLACKRKLQDFCLSQNNFVIPQIHFASLGCSPTKPKTHAIWVRKESLR